MQSDRGLLSVHLTRSACRKAPDSLNAASAMRYAVDSKSLITEGWCIGPYPLLVVGQGSLLGILTGLHEICLQLRCPLLSVCQKLPGCISIPQLHHTHQCASSPGPFQHCQSVP